MQVEHDKAKNLEKYIAFIEDAAAQGADYLAFSEISLQGYNWASSDDPEQMAKQKEYFERESEPIPGPATDRIQPYCKKYDMYVQFGLAEKAGDVMHNAAVLIGPEGILGTHRKVYGSVLPARPHAVFTRGDRFAVYDTRIGKVGMVICADLSYAPESVRTCVVQGAQVVVNTTAWGIPTSPMLPDMKTMLGYTDPGKMDPKTEYRAYQYDILTRYSALINQTWLVCSDTVGQSSMEKALGKKGGCHGHSRIITPIGKVVAEVGYKEGLAIATVNIQEGIDEAGYTTAVRHPQYKKFRPY
jgi:predicted amidohydrolase